MSADWRWDLTQYKEFDELSEDRMDVDKLRTEREQLLAEAAHRSHSGEYDWQSNWVKVSDFIPERGSMVLFWNKRWDQVLAGFIGYRGDYRSLSGVDLTNPIPTHWMALPTKGPHQ